MGRKNKTEKNGLKEKLKEVFTPTVNTVLILLLFFLIIRFVPVSIDFEKVIIQEIPEELIEVEKVELAQPAVKGEIKDAKDQTVNATFVLYNENGGLLSRTKNSYSKELVKNKTYNMEILPKEHVIKKIKINGIKDVQDASNLIKIDDVPESGDYVEVYAIDPTGLNFTNGTVTVTAKGDTLYKCKDWDFEEQECYGTWVKLMDIVPGEEYTFELTPEDPGYAELPIQNCYADDSAASRETWANPCLYSYPSTALHYDDALTENHSITKNKYTGLLINSSNTSITDCYNITKVEFCYKHWFSSGKSISACTMAFDADGGASPTTHTSTCPAGSEPAGITCDDITLLGETWTCDTFFGASPAGAVAYESFKGADPGTYYTDVFFFNVSYNTTPDSTPPATVTNLASPYQGTTWIYWNWTNPADADFDHTEVWINGTFYANVSAPDNFYNATGLTLDTSYEIQTRTVDQNGNINTTWVNDTNKTLADMTDPVINQINDAPDPVDREAAINFTANVTDNVNVSAAWVEIQGTNYSMTQSGSTDIWYYDILDTDITAGTYNYTVYANDTYGNNATPQAGNFTIQG
ncbi:hypothetical protein KY339_02650, partial [Candidatus Woesearchaeota archaeon]|nr:hypothetical protein [Candidatus Woesearchaeota archaeon]